MGRALAHLRTAAKALVPQMSFQHVRYGRQSTPAAIMSMLELHLGRMPGRSRCNQRTIRVMSAEALPRADAFLKG